MGLESEGGHNSSSLVILIDAIAASQKLRIAPVILEAAAEHRMVPHYRIAGKIRFDPVDLDKWVRCRRVDEVELDCAEVE